MKKDVTGIILLAGNSTRYGIYSNKNFELIDNNKTLLDYNLEVFLNNENIDDVILVIREEDILETYNIINKYKTDKKIKIINGGNTRKESVYKALNNTNSEIVIINDCARPFIKDEYINDLIKETELYWGSSIGVKSKDTIKICDEEDKVVETTNRNNTWIVQTPQCFNRKVLLYCHNNHLNDQDITDDCMLLEREGFTIKMVEGDYSNIKLTTIEDLDIIRSINNTKVKKLNK